MKPVSKNHWRKQFIKVLRITGNVTKAAKAAKRSRDTVYKHRKHSPKFSAAWDSAIDEASSRFEEELDERCLDRDSPNSHVLLIFKLKALKPELYRDNYTPRPQAASEATIDPSAAAAALAAARESHVRIFEPAPQHAPDPEGDPQHAAVDP